MDYKKLADLLYPDVDTTIEYWQNYYPNRNLPQGAEVTRVAPSPTGYLHIGTVYSSLISKLTANKSGGVFYVRLEDTDQKREIEKAGQIAYDMLCYFDLKPDEGYRGSAEQTGEYGDYIQSKRIHIYKAFAKQIVSLGRAFPCFCEKSESKADILERRQEQIETSENIETKDPCRNLSYEQIEKNIKAGLPFALRLLSLGDPEKTFEFVDLIKGQRTIRENDKDIVLVKSNGIPPYALAHLVDDTLMHTTTVVRGEEYCPSLAAHLEIFDAFGFKAPKYAHHPVVSKIDEEGNKRKLSKRKDPEADARFFVKEGYPAISVVEYLLNLLNSDFEIWRTKNPEQSYSEFPFSISKIGSNNPLFDLVKLGDVSKNLISHFSPSQIYEQALAWAKEFNEDFYSVIKDKKDYCLQLFTIDRTGNKPRKDIAKWSDIPQLYKYLFNDKVTEYDFDERYAKADIKQILSDYTKLYNEIDDKTTWFDKIKLLCGPNGYCADMKEYKSNPERYKGSVADVSTIIRVAITGQRTTPDLYEICKLLGQQKVIERLNSLK